VQRLRPISLVVPDLRSLIIRVFTNAEEGVNPSLISKADIVVICSSDEDYVTTGSGEICSGIKGENPAIKIVVAGYPEKWTDAFTSAGVDDFVFHVRSNLTETLDKFQKFGGISH